MKVWAYHEFVRCVPTFLLMQRFNCFVILWVLEIRHCWSQIIAECACAGVFVCLILCGVHIFIFQLHKLQAFVEWKILCVVTLDFGYLFFCKMYEVNFCKLRFWIFFDGEYFKPYLALSDICVMAFLCFCTSVLDLRIVGLCVYSWDLGLRHFFSASLLLHAW